MRRRAETEDTETASAPPTTEDDDDEEEEEEEEIARREQDRNLSAAGAPYSSARAPDSGLDAVDDDSSVEFLETPPSEPPRHLSASSQGGNKNSEGFAPPASSSAAVGLEATKRKTPPTDLPSPRRPRMGFRSPFSANPGHSEGESMSASSDGEDEATAELGQHFAAASNSVAHVVSPNARLSTLADLADEDFAVPARDPDEIHDEEEDDELHQFAGRARSISSSSSEGFSAEDPYLIAQEAVELLRSDPARGTMLAYDPVMLEHHHPKLKAHPERPFRILAIHNALEASGLAQLCQRVSTAHLAHTPEAEEVFQEDLGRIHSEEHLAFVSSCTNEEERELHAMTLEMRSAFASQGTVPAALASARLVLHTTESVARSRVANGLCVVRPPGHHAEHSMVCGFCWFNNVAVAAAAARARMGSERVLIVDWDVHHGNGIAHAFEEDPSVLYVSLHRYEHGAFYPGQASGDPKYVGRGAGAGYNINIGWNSSREPGPPEPIGDAEYLYAFDRIVMPAARRFDPTLVLISCGFDAALGDPLGGCRLTSTGYAHMLHALKSLANGRVVIALEGGYNLRALCEGSLALTKVLLGHPPPPWEGGTRPVSAPAIRACEETLRAHAALTHVPFAMKWTSGFRESSSDASSLLLHETGAYDQMRRLLMSSVSGFRRDDARPADAMDEEEL